MPKEIKSNLDEMQEKKLKNSESNIMWLAYWLLLAVILVQVGMKAPFVQLAGEFAVFMIMAITGVISNLINGIWAPFLKPDLKTNLAAAGIAAGVILIFWLLISRGQWATGAILSAVFTFSVVLGLLQLAAMVYKRRRKTLDEEEQEE